MEKRKHLNIFKVVKIKLAQRTNLDPTKLYIKNKDEIKTFKDCQNYRKFVVSTHHSRNTKEFNIQNL